MNCSDKFQQFLVGCERPCDPAARRSWVRGALFDSRYIFCVCKGDYWKNFWLFHVNGYTRLLRSILVLLFSLLAWKWPRSASTQAVAYVLLVLLVLMHLAVFRTIAFTQNGEVYTVNASAELFCLGNLDIISTNSLFCSICSCAQSPLVIFWEPSTTKSSSLSRAPGWRGRQESDSQVTCHQLVSVTHCSVDVI